MARQSDAGTTVLLVLVGLGLFAVFATSRASSLEDWINSHFNTDVNSWFSGIGNWITANLGNGSPAPQVIYNTDADPVYESQNGMAAIDNWEWNPESSPWGND